jgi:hypothetical protein
MNGMKVLTYESIRTLLPGASTNVLQRFGWDEEGRRLKIDGDAGPLTKGATFYVPEAADQLLVSFGLAEIILGAQEAPVGRNMGPYVAKYYMQDFDPDKNYGAWCAAFTGWCIRQAYGDDAPYSWGARRLFKRVRLWEHGHEVPLTEAQPGDIILWSRDSAGPWNGHIGIVCGEDDKYVYTVEGNAGPFVRIYRYSKADDLKMPKDPCLGICRITHPKA